MREHHGGLIDIVTLYCYLRISTDKFINQLGEIIISKSWLIETIGLLVSYFFSLTWQCTMNVGGMVSWGLSVTF